MSRRQVTAGKFGAGAGESLRRDVEQLLDQVKRRGTRAEDIRNARRLIAFARSLPAAAKAAGAADQLQTIVDKGQKKR